MEELPVNANTINKAIDIVDESTKETRKSLDKNLSNGVNKFFDLLSATPVSRAISLYIEEAQYKLEEARKKMQEKYEQIPLENRIDPNPRIALSVANEFNYCLDEEHIKEMFTNILVSDMNKTKKVKVLPSYIETVRQLSKEDAEFLKFLEKYKKITFPIIQLRYVTSNGGFKEISNNIIIFDSANLYSINPIVLDNLIRLRILEIPEGTYLINFNGYEEAFEILKKHPEFASVPKNFELKYDKKELCFTQYGKNFIDICLS